MPCPALRAIYCVVSDTTCIQQEPVSSRRLRVCVQLARNTTDNMSWSHRDSSDSELMELAIFGCQGSCIDVVSDLARSRLANHNKVCACWHTWRFGQALYM